MLVLWRLAAQVRKRLMHYLNGNGSTSKMDSPKELKDSLAFTPDASGATMYVVLLHELGIVVA